MFAAFHSAELLYKSNQGPESESQILNLLTEAASGDCVPALRTVGYLAMQDSLLSDLASRCMTRAAQLGDPVSAFNLGWSLLQGPDAAAEEPLARWLLQRATAAGYPFADLLLAPLQEVQARAPEPGPRQELPGYLLAAAALSRSDRSRT